MPLGNILVAESTQTSLKPAATININFSKVAEDQTILHTAVTRCKEQPVTVLFDCGSNGTMITKAATERLNLRARNASKNLQLETIQGESQITTKEVVVPLRETSPSKRHHPKVISKTEPDVVNLNCFILDTFMEIQSERPKPDLKKDWPELSEKASKQAQANIVQGSVDIIIGIDQMYKKVASGKAISHPTKELTAIETRFGWSVGGNTIYHLTSGNIEPSSSKKSQFREIKLKAFTLTTTELLAPLVKDQDADPTEVEIKNMIETVFDTECAPDDLGKDKLTVDQRYTVDQFHFKKQSKR